MLQVVEGRNIGGSCQWSIAGKCVNKWVNLSFEAV
jgi:hypothetical protein